MKLKTVVTSANNCCNSAKYLKGFYFKIFLLNYFISKKIKFVIDTNKSLKFFHINTAKYFPKNIQNSYYYNYYMTNDSYFATLLNENHMEIIKLLKPFASIC